MKLRVKALRKAEADCELSEWKISMQMDSLALACALQGNTQEAIRWQERAIATASPGFDIELAKQQLDVYAPWRFSIPMRIEGMGDPSWLRRYGGQVDHWWRSRDSGEIAPCPTHQTSDGGDGQQLELC
ncbi:MAG: hypothetical protein IH991_15555 [Planctomycetes bacterium]|nr:hypothetical protein [Planctomycetota bacterium]